MLQVPHYPNTRDVHHSAFSLTPRLQPGFSVPGRVESYFLLLPGIYFLVFRQVEEAKYRKYSAFQKKKKHPLLWVVHT
jgi:hypothetical protein